MYAVVKLLQNESNFQLSSTHDDFSVQCLIRLVIQLICEEMLNIAQFFLKDA